MTNPLLLIALGFLTGGFIAINKFAPEPTQVGEHVVTQKGLYTGLVRSAAFKCVFKAEVERRSSLLAFHCFGSPHRKRSFLAA